MTDPFRHNSPGLESPAIALTAITPNDAENQPRVLRAIYVGQGGNLVVQDTEGNIVTFRNLVSGATVGPFRVARVMTASTAGHLVGYV
ncbi:MAG: hypothetical protein KGZ68_12570 [Dechloromonas sp.]|nr:hypothetical protein [Dechloromonas sp.]